MKRINIYILLAWLCFGCSDWLDVKPSDRLSEEAAFSNLANFKQTLNGVYIELNSDALYGEALTYGTVEILSQRYDINSENKEAYAFSQYDYAGASVEMRLEQIWGKAYNVIANTNLIIENCETHREVLADKYYNIIKGEALALRGMLHFDLQRLFGPLYAQDSTLISLPYYKKFSLTSEPQSPANLFMRDVIDDLRHAERLLQDDPIIENGVKGDAGDDFLQDRNLRLNYYAVQGLLSRAYMYVGRPDSALYYAEKIIEVQEEKFPWIERNDALMGGAPDRVFSTELVFALENRNVGSAYARYFDASVLKGSSLLGIRKDVTEYLFDGRDYRYMSFLKGEGLVNNVSYSLFNKFYVADSLHAEMMPMVRASEAYLTAAEILLEEDPGRSRELLNKVYVKRGLEEISWYPGESDITEEWYKEFVGEGQLFFYYKRKMMEQVQSPRDPYGRVSISLSKYELPIPDAEIKYN